MSGSELLLYIGIAVMVVAALGGLASAAALRLSGKRLKARLEGEFGKRRH